MDRGDTISLHKEGKDEYENFKILEFIGGGASAVCYSAVYDNIIGTLKEFYPLDIRLERDGENYLIPKNKREFKKKIKEYAEPHKILKKAIKKNPKIAKFLPQFTHFYDKNGNLYLFTHAPAVKSFETFCKEIHEKPTENSEKKLFHILTAIKSLTECIKILHKADLIHRDIKPANFGFPTVGDKNISDNISVFDINSLYYIYDSEYDMAWSEGFSEPEAEFNTKPLNKTDIYSIGACLYYALTGETYKGNPEDIETVFGTSELLKSVANVIHPKVKKLILKILTSALCPRRIRYSDCETLQDDLNSALDYLIPAGKQETSDKNTYFALQYHVYKNPLYTYADSEINALILGFGKYGQKYLDIILQTCQIPDKKLNVTIISDTAQKGKEEYLKERPKLAEFFNIDGSLADDSDSYGNINFISHKFSENITENENFLKSLEKKYSSVFVAMGFDRFNTDMAETACGISDKCLVSAVLEKHEKLPENRAFIPVYVYDDYSKVSQDIERMAFNVHLIWEQNLNVDLDEVKKEYRKLYNHDSNIAFVVSMKYRLYFIGFDMDKMSAKEISREYVKYLSNGKNKEISAYWEHRRWNVEKAVAGWNTLKNLSDCVGLCGNKNKKQKLLTCLVKSSLDKENLSSWSMKQWDTAEKKDLAEKLDELDTMSVRLHQTFKRYIEDKKFKFDLHGGISAEISKDISNDPVCYSAFRELVSNMENIFNRQKNQWKRYKGLKSAFLKTVEESKYFGRKKKEEIKNQTELLDSQFFPVLESRKYTNYKTYDEDLVSGIPFILNYSTSDFYLVVPYVSEKNMLFKNLASATVLNPSNIIYPVRITEKAQLDEIQESLPFIESYMNSKKLRARIEFVIGLSEELSADSDLETTFKKNNSRILRVKIKNFSNNKDFVEFLKKYLTEKKSGKRNFLIEENNTNLSGMLSISGDFSRFEFNFNEDKFKNINDCDIVNYIHKRPALTTTDMTALRQSRNIHSGSTGFFGDYLELGDKYFNNTGAWKALCTCLKNFSENNDLLAEFPRTTNAFENPNFWLLPFACRDSVIEILDVLKEEKIIKSYNISTVSAQTFKAEITYRLGDKAKFDKIFANVNGLMLGQVKPVVCTRSRIVKIVYNDLYVKNLDCSNIGTNTINLLKYFADKKYLINFTYNNKKANFIYSSYPIKGLLTQEGRILEIYTYHKARETGFFDDLNSSLEILWENETAKNEVDLIATKGLNSLFIECKATKWLENDFYSKIKGIADTFGINSKTVLIGDTQDTPETSAKNQKCRDFGKIKGVITVSDRNDIENIGETLVKIMKGEYK